MSERFIRHHTFDPLTGYTNDHCELPGVAIWPSHRKWKDANPRIMVLGGSTTMWPPEQPLEYSHLLGTWALTLGQLLENEGYTPLIFNVAACGYTSDQELLRLLRDGPGLQPHLVIAVSGVNDFGFLHATELHPYINRFQAALAAQITKTSPELPDYGLGVPWKCATHERWLRNIRLCNAIACDLNAKYLACLQPLLGIPPSLPNTTRETEMLTAIKYQPCGHSTYPQEASSFYETIRSELASRTSIYPFAADISDTLADKPDVWADHRHPNSKGNALLAARINQEIKTRNLITA